MRLNIKAFALTCGILWSVTMLLMTAFIVVRNDSSTVMDMFSAIYFGYTVSWAGAIIGAIWGFFDGLVCGAIFAWVYNRLCGAHGAPN